MPRISLFNLPAEVHFEILKNALCSSQQQYYSTDNEERSPVTWDWIEEEGRGASLFPYNAAAVCQLWHEVLIQIPECWTRVIIDVATDPNRFLDIFLWSKDLPKLHVTVFNSHTPTSDNVDYSSLERERVSAIVDALLPHTSRCKSITFDVAFATSLPSPVLFLLEDAPHLYELALECKIDNARPPDEYSRACELDFREPIQTLSSFPRLTMLSMPGFWFMFISGHPHTSEWFKKICGEEGHGVSHFCMSHFKFQKEGQYTLQNFVKYCLAVKPISFALSDLSLDHDGPILEGDERDDEVFSFNGSVRFKNVSANVIQTLFFLANISPTILIFDNCAFPEEILSSGASELNLRNIPYFIQGDSDARKDSTNLASILHHWSGISLNVVSCPSFDETILAILSGHKDSMLLSLRLDDCDNVTVRGIRKYLERRNTRLREVQAPYDGGFDHLEDLVVCSTSFPSEEDKEWFRTSDCVNSTNIRWILRNQGDLTGPPQEFFKREYE